MVSVGASIALLVIDLVEEGTKQTFKQILEDFSKEKSTFEIIYKKESNQIESGIDEILKLAYDMSWWELSWRAIVPLYSRGFKLYREGSGEVSYGETSKMISKMISGSTLKSPGVYAKSDYGKDTEVIKYLYDFSQDQKNNTDANSDGVPDAVEWLNGTIHPEMRPGIYDPNPVLRAAP